MKKILIVDDEEGQRDMLRAVLKKAGYRTDTACSGEEAIEKAGEKDFDVFLIDMIMPGKSGIDIMPEIKRLRPRAKMIIVNKNSLDFLKYPMFQYPYVVWHWKFQREFFPFSFFFFKKAQSQPDGLCCGLFGFFITNKMEDAKC